MIFESKFCRLYLNDDYISFRKSDGTIHRLNNKPAELWQDGSLAYYVDEKYHRTDGPASILLNYYEIDIYYYIHDNLLSEEEFLKWRRNEIFD